MKKEIFGVAAVTGGTFLTIMFWNNVGTICSLVVGEGKAKK